MKKTIFRVDGEEAGTCDRLNIIESTPANYYNNPSIRGAASKLKFKRMDLFRKLTESIASNISAQLEFENENFIWKFHRVRVASYTYNDYGPDFAVVVNELDFSCEMTESILKNKFKLERLPAPIVKTTEPDQETINKFTAAVSSYYKRDK